MTSSLFRAALAAAALAPSSAASLRAAPEADAKAGREIVRKYADVIVGVELVAMLKVKQRDRELPPSERRIEVNGTVISASGLTVTSLALVDPRAAFDILRSSNPNMPVELLSADIKEVKLRLADNTEVPAKFVFKDADLDLAFMAPDPEQGATGRKFAHVNLGANAEGQLLGTYFYVSRAAKALQRVPLVRVSEITGMIERPRKVYLLTEQSVGTPVFDPKGRILGVSLQHISGGRNTGLVVLPAEDIAEMARQAEAAAGRQAD